VPDVANIVFRRAVPDDADAVGDLHADSWRRHYRGAYSDSFLDGDVVTDRRTVWRQRLTAPTVEAATIVAVNGDELVGFIHVVFDSDPQWGALVDNLHVRSGHGRSGVGTRLMAEGAGAVMARPEPRPLYLWVLEQNVAGQAFYDARGGRCVERALVDAPGGDPTRLNGSPAKLRYVWDDLNSLVVSLR
jgi:ribosomal protein S18 acetylase RimI-like enzyme